MLAAELLVTEAGDPIDPRSPPRTCYAARYRYRPVRCGNKTCRACPHRFYLYRCWYGQGRRRQEKYLGPAQQLGSEYERPQLRAAKQDVAQS